MQTRNKIELLSIIRTSSCVWPLNLFLAIREPSPLKMPGWPWSLVIAKIGNFGVNSLLAPFYIHIAEMGKRGFPKLAKIKAT